MCIRAIFTPSGKVALGLVENEWMAHPNSGWKNERYNSDFRLAPNWGVEGDVGLEQGYLGRQYPRRANMDSPHSHHPALLLLLAGIPGTGWKFRKSDSLRFGDSCAAGLALGILESSLIVPY